MKLWAVTIERTIMVLAEDETSAEDVGRDAEKEELLNDPDICSAIEVSELKEIPYLWRDCYPYGGDHNGADCAGWLSTHPTVRAATE